MIAPNAALLPVIQRVLAEYGLPVVPPTPRRAALAAGARQAGAALGAAGDCARPGTRTCSACPS